MNVGLRRPGRVALPLTRGAGFRAASSTQSSFIAPRPVLTSSFDGEMSESKSAEEIEHFFEVVRAIVEGGWLHAKSCRH